MDNDVLSQKERCHYRAVKLGTVAIHRRIDGIQDFNLQDCSFRQGVERIPARRIETSLQVKVENCSSGNSNRRGDRTPAMGGTGNHSDETQNSNQGTMHGLDLSSSEQ